MNRTVFYIALTLVLCLQPGEGGFIKKAISGIINGKQTPNGHAQNYVGDDENAWKQHGGSAAQQYGDTSWNNHRYPTQNANGPSRGHRPTGASQGYKNTTAHIIDEDYLVSTENEKIQHQNRPTSQYGGGGTYNKRPSSSGPYKNTTAHIIDEDYLMSTKNETIQHQNRPTSQYGGGGTYNKRPSSSGPYKNTTAHIIDEDYLMSTKNETMQHQNRPTSQYGGGGTYDKRPSTQVTSQQRPNTQRPSYQNQQRPNTQMPSYQNQQRPNTQIPNYHNQQRPNTQTPSYQNQYRPNEQTPSYQNEYGSNPQSPFFPQQQRPTTGYRDGGTYHKRYASFPRDHERGFGGGTSQSGGQRYSHRQTGSTQGYKNTTAHIVDQDYLKSNQKEYSQHRQRPVSQYGGGGSYNKRDTSQMVYRKEATPTREHPQGGNRSRASAQNRQTSKSTTEVVEQSGKAEQNKQTPGDSITLKSDSITCIYSNIFDEKIENRNMRCNDTDCKLERNFVKSSLWICKEIKCTVANVDFSQDHGRKKLIECDMSDRHIIQVPDRRIKCGPDEREYKGRCRKVW